MEIFEGIGFYITGIESFWILTTVVTFILMVTFFLETYGDRRFNRINKINGARKIVAEFAIRRQALKVMAVLFLMIPALLSGLYEVATPGIRAINLICLSMVPLTLMLVNIVDRFERSALDDYFINATPSERRLDLEHAIQKQEADAVDVQEQTDDGSEVG